MHGPLNETIRDPVWHIRQQAAIALGEIGAHRAIAALHRATVDERPAVRLAAGRALVRITGAQVPRGT